MEADQVWSAYVAISWMMGNVVERNSEVDAEWMEETNIPRDDHNTQSYNKFRVLLYVVR